MLDALDYNNCLPLKTKGIEKLYEMQGVEEAASRLKENTGFYAGA